MSKCSFDRGRGLARRAAREKQQDKYEPAAPQDAANADGQASSLPADRDPRPLEPLAGDLRLDQQTLHELQRLQATRAGAGNPPPLALDVGGLG